MENRTLEFWKYVVNGLFATLVHYAAFIFFLNILHIQSAGLANLMAAGIGVTCSFLGNRYFVFQKHEEGIATQAAKFTLLYLSIALLHGVIMFIWSDKLNLDYRVGFMIATCFQFLFSYMGNKKMVFNP